MKKFKSIFKVLLTSLLAMSFVMVPQAAFASDGTAEENVYDINEGVDVTREEVADSISKNEDIPYEEAVQQLVDYEVGLIAEHRNASMDVIAPRTMTYKRYFARKNVAFMTLEASAYVSVVTEGSIVWFDEILSKDSGVTGLSILTSWHGDVNAIKVNDVTLLIDCYGYLEGSVDFSLSAAVEASIVAAGLELGIGGSGAVTISGSVNFSETHKLGY